MIIHSLCNSCYQRYELLIEPGDVHLLKDILVEDVLAPCPRNCGGKINVASSMIAGFADDPQLSSIIRLNAKELFKAVKGGGLPDEIPNSPEVVEALLLAHKVQKVSVQKIMNNIYLHELHLENGAVMHLASGARGAQVLKITKREAT